MADPTSVHIDRLGFAGVSISAIALLVAGCSVFEPPTVSGDGGTDAGVRMDAGRGDASPADGGPGDAGPGDAGPGDAGVDAGPGDAGVDAGAPDAGPSCVVESIMSADECTGSVVINEVDGSGTDFTELYNRGTAAVNISGWIIADASGGGPDLAGGIVVPDGTVLDPGRFLHVWANLAAPQPGIRTSDCIPGAPPPCLHSSWGISSGGERVYLLDDTLTLICTFEYPTAVFAGEAFGRFPDGETTLCPTDPSPGEVNVPTGLR